MFGSLLVSGVFVHIALQVIMNVAVVLNIMPNTRCHIAIYQLWRYLHFVPDGGEGLALSVARQIKFQEPEFIL